MSLLSEITDKPTIQEFIKNTFDPTLKQALIFAEKGTVLTVKFMLPTDGIEKHYAQLLSEAVENSRTDQRYNGLTIEGIRPITKIGYSGNPEYPCRNFTLGFTVLVTRLE